MDAEALMTKGAEADGEVVWFWRPDAGVKSREFIFAAMVANKPGHQEEHEGNRNTIACGNAG